MHNLTIHEAVVLSTQAGIGTVYIRWSEQEGDSQPIPMSGNLYFHTRLGLWHPFGPIDEWYGMVPASVVAAAAQLFAHNWRESAGTPCRN